MNLSSRWCVTAVVALGAVACSDPVPTASQGAIYVTIQSSPSAPSNKNCPSGASSTYDVPHVDPNAMKMGKIVDEVLDDNTYLHWIVDGQDKSIVNCSVKGGASGYSFSGRVTGPTQANVGGTPTNGLGSMQITNGTLDGTGKGTATITFSNTAGLSQPLGSPPDKTFTGVSGGGQRSASMAISSRASRSQASCWSNFSCTSPCRSSSASHTTIPRGIARRRRFMAES